MARRLIYQGQTGPLDTSAGAPPETITPDKWLAPEARPTQHRRGIRGESAFVYAPAAAVAAVSAGFISTVAVTFTKALIYQSVAACPVPIAAAETVTVDKWNATAAIPAHRANRVHLYNRPDIDPLPRVAPVSAWGARDVIPARKSTRPQPQSELVQIVSAPVETITLDKWNGYDARPALRKLLGRSLPAEVLTTAGERITPDKWGAVDARPIRTRYTPRNVFTLVYTPAAAEIVTLDKWNGQPARPAIRKQAPPAQVSLDPFPRPPLIDRWLGGDVRPAARRYAPRADTSFVRVELITLDKWFVNLERPAPRKVWIPGVYSSITRSFEFTTAIPRGGILFRTAEREYSYITGDRVYRFSALEGDEIQTAERVFVFKTAERIYEDEGE